MEPTSEQELRQLLDEGKITEEEYKELLEAIRQKETVQEPVEKPSEAKPRTGFGKAALILMIIGLLMPAVPFIFGFIFHIGVIELLIISLIFGGPCFLLAFIFGIIGWKTTSGKVAAIGVPCLGLLIVPGLLFLSFICIRGKAVIELPSRHFVGLKTYPLDSMDGVITQKGIEFDPHISADGNGSLKITTDSVGKTVIRLFETGPIDVENRILMYSAKLRSGALGDKAYLEMWCNIPGKGEFFSRGLGAPIENQTNWTHAQAPFQLEAGQVPANVKLNLVIEGIGTVWIDEIMLASEFDPHSESCTPACSVEKRGEK